MSRASELTEAIKNYLILHGIFCWRNNTVGVYDPVKRIYRMNKQQMKGAPDIIGIMPDGRFLGVEVKVGRDKISTFQEIFRENCERNKGIYIEARNLDAVINFMDSYDK